MQHLLEMVYQGVAVILFCVAFTLFIMQIDKLELVLRKEKGGYEKDVVYQQPDVALQDNFVTRGELQAYFLMPLEYDIEINGVIYRKEEERSYQMNQDTLKNDWYIKDYLYEIDGQIKRIVFTGSFERRSFWEEHFQDLQHCLQSDFSSL